MIGLLPAGSTDSCPLDVSQQLKIMCHLVDDRQVHTTRSVESFCESSFKSLIFGVCSLRLL
jgi:hypothetical protein